MEQCLLLKLVQQTVAYMLQHTQLIQLQVIILLILFMIKVLCSATFHSVYLKNRISIFPRHRLCPDKNHYINCTKYIDNTKNGHFLEKLVLRNNSGQHHLYLHKTDTYQFHIQMNIQLILIFQTFLQHSGCHRLALKTQGKLRLPLIHKNKSKN